ncbi:PadR family transcriptional regulator [Agromyces soli]
MAVREALLALLTIGPAYGFALHGGLAERTGGRRSINVGQTYATLERAAKAGLIEPAGATPDGLPLHRLTASGRLVAEGWLSGVDAPGADPVDETVDRVLIAASLPGADLDGVLRAERARWGERLAAATAAGAASSAADAASGGHVPQPAGEAEGPRRAAVDGLRRLSAAAEASMARASLAWLDEVAGVEASALSFGASAERPRRGRRRSAPAEPAVSGSEPAQASASA